MPLPAVYERIDGPHGPVCFAKVLENESESYVRDAARILNGQNHTDAFIAKDRYGQMMDLNSYHVWR